MSTRRRACGRLVYTSVSEVSHLVETPDSIIKEFGTINTALDHGVHDVRGEGTILRQLGHHRVGTRHCTRATVK